MPLTRQTHKQLNFLTIVVLILLAGWALRLTLYDWHGLEGDDAVALNLTRYATGTLIEGLRRQELDVHPPLYFVALQAWVSMAGESLLALRWLNFAADMLTGALLIGLTHYLANRRAAWLAGTLWLSAPLLHYVAYTIRMYSLLTLWVTLATYCLLIFLYTPHPKRRYVVLIGFGMASLAALYTHIYGAIALASYGFMLVLLAYRRWRKALAGLIALALTGILFIPFGIPIAHRFMSGGELGAQNPNLLPPPLEVPGHLLQTLLTHRGLNSPLIGLILLALFVLIAAILWRGRVRMLIIIFGTSFVAVVVLALTSSVYRPRYLAPFVPLALALSAIALTRLPHRIGIVTFIGAMVISVYGFIANLYRAVYDDWVAAAGYIETYQQTGDVIIVIPDWGAKALTYHYRGGLPMQALLSSVSPDSDLDTLLGSVIAGYERVWLVRYQVDVSDPTNRADEWFQQHAALVTEVFPTAIQVKLYDFAPKIDNLPENAHPLDAQFGDKLSLQGAWLPITRGSSHDLRLHPPSNWVHITLYLDALRSNIPDMLRVRLTDSIGNTWGGALERPNNLLHRVPLSTWQEGDLYRVGFDLNINPAAPVGSYNVEVMLLDSAGQPIRTTGADAGDFWVIAGQFMVE